MMDLLLGMDCSKRERADQYATAIVAEGEVAEVRERRERTYACGTTQPDDRADMGYRLVTVYGVHTTERGVAALIAATEARDAAKRRGLDSVARRTLFLAALTAQLRS